MQVRSLLLERFRSFTTQEVSFEDASLILLLGPNGSGKTNILEALALLSTGDSCLGAELSHMVRWNESHYKIRGMVARDEGEELALEVVATLTPRNVRGYFINDVRKKFAEFIGAFPTIVFLPEDLSLFSASPARRRDFLDAFLVQTVPSFHSVGSDYERVLKQRNALLRSIQEGTGKRSDLPVWDSALAEAGAKVHAARLRSLEELQPALMQHVVALGEKWSDIHLFYTSKCTSVQESDVRAELQSLLTHFGERDILVGTTTVGPHRDDWHVQALEHDIATFASRGQQRTALLALLFAMVEVLHTTRNERPVILLDDVFSELDDHHQHALLGHLESYQTFLTTTHVPSGWEGTVWDVKEGNVSRRGAE